MMRQFHAAKGDHPDEVLFFRMGDFYEMFFDDARLVSELLGITLTSRSKDKSGQKIPMAGIPVKSVDGYIQKLVEAGHRVAICEQVGDAAEAKGIVDRQVVRVVTPGTFVPEESLEDHSPIHLAAYRPAEHGLGGLAWVDLSTGKFHCQDLDQGEGTESLLAIQPREILIPEGFDPKGDPLLEWLTAYLPSCTCTRWPEWHFELESARQRLLAHFAMTTLDGFGVEHMNGAIGTAGALLEYLQQTQRQSLVHITSLRSAGQQRKLGLDASTHRALDLLEVTRTGERRGSLLGLLDKTRTAMGARLLREWIQSPLADAPPIRSRQSAISGLVRDKDLRDSLRSVLSEVRDIERLASRLPMGRIHGRDLRSLARSLNAVPDLETTLKDLEPHRFVELVRDLDGNFARSVAQRIEDTVVEDPPMTLTEGGLIRDGYDPDLDELRAVSRDGVSWMARFEAEESARTGIPTLKVGYNRVFGYYIEVTHTHSSRIPETYIRKQTLKNAERYITPELKEMEEKVLGSKERADQLELEIFQQLREELLGHIRAFQTTSAVIAEVDVFQSLARVAAEEEWCAPEIVEEPILKIEEGFHPVVGAGAARSEFTPNDVVSGEGPTLAVITGPNMAGKSTYIRQTALISILGQMGSYVPATKAVLGLADRIFTRVGAADDLVHGQSTFMVEMVETARILHNATDRSLVILDEVGRGTSTHDGISIAWAIAEDLATRVKSRTFFATHYHELVALEELMPGHVSNLCVEVKEWKDEIVFLHKIRPGSADKSYGIHVARLAGVPAPVLKKARTILSELESTDHSPAAAIRHSEAVSDLGALQQPGLFDEVERVFMARIKDVDPDELSPKDALNLIYELRKQLP
ncbi:DNA mismatch repair protein MutS [bacterium TMED181]|nr:DNA mismatch repair protein MutS [Planctomycetota bacterium]OUW46189.1 MAG: DNA mismatch repair protein MutS [bacterium TMED181]